MACYLKRYDYNDGAVTLINESVQLDGRNIYSIIIGNNGSGKSRLLCSIAKDSKAGAMWYSHYLASRPSKVIAITNSFSDRFPLDKASLAYMKSDLSALYHDEDYVYLGNKMRFGNYSKKYVLDRALRICAEQYDSSFVALSIRRVFEFLGYRPIVKVQFSPVRDIARFEEKISRFDRYYDRYHRLENEQDDIRVRDILERFSHDSHQQKFQFIFNFSEKNMERMNNYARENNNFAFDLHDFLLLRKYKAIRSYHITVYKNNGAEFAFDEASSGEASILVSFLSMIPLLQDNCLLLIDEPEISLHPAWQSSYIKLLQGALSAYSGCHVLIASHSHLLLSELQSDCSSVVVMERNSKGEISSRLLDYSPYAWSAENILLNVFGVPSCRNYYFAEKVQSVLNILASEQKDMDRFRREMYDIKRLSASLSDADPLKHVVDKLEKYEASHK